MEEFEMPRIKRIYSLHMCSSGYLQICTSVNGRNKNIRIHRCVAETFLNNPYGYEIVNHIDGKKTNNRLDNLEWCSRRDNYNHAVEMDLIDPSIPYQLAQNSRFGYYQGSYNGMAKLTENDVIYIRSNYIPKGKGAKVQPTRTCCLFWCKCRFDFQNCKK